MVNPNQSEDTRIYILLCRPFNWVADIYFRTLPMSTFSLAMVVCDFDFRETATRSGTVVGILSQWAVLLCLKLEVPVGFLA